MRTVMLAAALAAAASSAGAASVTLAPPLLGLSFLVGNWKSGVGKVAETGGTSVGASHFTVEADGHMLLRRDRTQTFNKVGEPSGAFSQTMLIYPDAGSLRADYGDGEGHVIHYTSASVTPGRSVVFSSPAQAAAPGFQLRYTLIAKGELDVEFGTLAPDGAALHLIASGVLKKVR